MGIDATTTTTQPVPTIPSDPFANVGDDQVLRCQDPETGWQWFYDRDGGEILKYHERDGYAPTETADRLVAATMALERVDSCAVSEVYLEVFAGENDG